MNFFIICILVRLILVYTAKYVDKSLLRILGYITLIPSIGFIYLYLFDKRKIGLEVGGKSIWWNKLRPIHGILYLLFSIYAIKKEEFAWIPLLIDTILGVIFYTIKYYF